MFDFNQFDNQSYYGGQGSSGHYQRIINVIPKCDVYCEPFLGHSSVIRNLNVYPSAIIGIEKDAAVIDKWKQNKPELMHLYHADYTAILPVLTMFYGKKIVVHFDPPYRNTSSPKKYNHDLTESDYHFLLKFILDVSGSNIDVIVSHWKDDLFDSYLCGTGNFKHYPFKTMSHRGKPIENGFYLNFDQSKIELLDYSHAGKNFTDRQRIQRKTDRMYIKIMSMPAAERNLLLNKIRTQK